MNGARGLIVASIAALGIIVFASLSYGLLSSRGSCVLDSGIVPLAQYLDRIQSGEAVLSQPSISKILEGSLLAERGARGMVSASGHGFLLCGLLAVAATIFQIMLLRRLAERQ